MRMILRSIVIDLGFQVAEASHGKEAWELIDPAAPPNLMLVDLHMPGMNGIDLVKLARSEPRLSDVRIVMITSDGELDNISAALEAGADEYLTKPFEAESLIQKLEKLGIAG